MQKANSMNLLIVLSFGLYLFNIKAHVQVRKTTYDEDFEDLYEVEHIAKGDEIHFPENYKFVRLKYKGYIPVTGQVFDSTDSQGGVYEFQLRPSKTNIISSIKHLHCWDEAYPRMSTGERIIIICPSHQAFGNQGLVRDSKVIVKPGETVAYELEMVNAQYDPFNFTLIRKGINDIYPQYHDLLRYKYEVWVEDDRDYIVTTYDSGNLHFNGVSFDHSDSICITEAVRRLSVGGIAEIFCPYRYVSGGQTFPKQHVPQDADLSFRIQLLAIKQMKWYLHSPVK